MKIAVINNLFKPFQRGGAELVAEFQAEGFKRLGHEVIVITSLPESLEGLNDKYPIYRLGGFPATFSRLQKMPTYLRAFWHLVNIFDLIEAFRIYRILKKEKIDLVITNNLFGLGLLVPLAVKFTRTKCLAVLHDIQLLHPSGLMFFGKESVINSFAAKIYQRLTCLLFSSVNAVSAPSSWLLELYSARGFFKKAKQAVIANPDIDQFHLPHSSTPSFTMLYMAQLEVHKGILLLLEAVNSLPGDWKLMIMGDGSQQPRVESAVQNDSRIIFMPWQPERQAEIMSQADLLISPSLCYENSPLAIKRAQSAGLPVIASDLGGAVEMFNGKDFLFTPTAAALNEKLQAIISGRLELKNDNVLQKPGDYCQELLALSSNG